MLRTIVLNTRRSTANCCEQAFCSVPSWIANDPPAIKRRRIVVTGMGVVTPIGVTVDSFWNAIKQKQSGISRLLPLDPSQFTEEELSKQYPFRSMFSEELFEKCGTTYAGVVKEELVNNSPKQTREMSRFLRFIQNAAIECLQNAKLLHTLTEETRKDIGVVCGTGIGSLDDICEMSLSLNESINNYRRVSPYFFSKIIPSSPAGWVAKGMQLPDYLAKELGRDKISGFTGAVAGSVAACAAGQLSVIQGAHLIQSDPSVNIMLCGSTDAPIHSVSLSGFAKIKALSRNFNNCPEKASRPFDKERDGFVMSEGAGMICLEELEHAQSRGAPILAELRGYATSGDGYHMFQPPEDGRGAALAMRKALDISGLEARNIDYVAAHGTSTPLGDVAEFEAIQNVFGDHTRNLYVSSIKGHIGHLLGAAGIVQAVSCIKAIQTNTIPPTLNLHTVDEKIVNKTKLPTEPEIANVNAVMSNSFGFGGINTCLLFTKPPCESNKQF